MQTQMTPELMQKFQIIDTDNSGTITVDEIANAYKHIRFPASSAKLLLRGISDMPYIDRTTFPIFDSFVMSFYQVFMNVN